MSPFAITADSFTKVVVVLDSSVASSAIPLAVHAQSSDKTIFISGKDIATYLTSLETADTKVQVVDFEALKEEAGNAAAGAAAAAGASKQAQQEKKEKETAKVEGAVQIAIGVKKEVDFAGWYTNVSVLKNKYTPLKPHVALGASQSRYVRLL